MRSIGIRVEPSGVTFAIYDSENREIINIEKLIIPKALDVPEQLKFIRSNILDILREYGIERAGIRITEPNAQRMNIPRIQIEGVIQETFASSPVNSYFTGQISSISSKLGFNRSDFKKYIDNTMIYLITTDRTS